MALVDVVVQGEYLHLAMGCKIVIKALALVINMTFPASMTYC
jgi:N-dimethylarginine dimethylaminohydrolase